MAEIINFNKARKRKARQDAEKLAAENRARFGRTAVAKTLDEDEAREARLKLDQHQREKPPADD